MYNYESVNLHCEGPWVVDKIKEANETYFCAKLSACIAAKKSRNLDVINDAHYAGDVDDVDDAVDAGESDAEDDRKSHHAFINLEAITNKEVVPIKVKCWDCTKIITTSELLKCFLFKIMKRH